MGELGLIILGFILAKALGETFRGWGRPFRGGRPAPPRRQGMLRTLIMGREQTRAKRLLAADREKRKARTKRKEGEALRRAEARLDGKRGFWR